MKLRQVHIKNYRSCKDVKIEFESMHALVGANNAGKSTIIRALDLLFNPTITKIDEESFWDGDTDLQIWIEAVFEELTEAEKNDEKLKPYLRPEGTFHIARSAKQKDDGSGADEAKFEINQHYCKPVPKLEWLQESKIKGANIDTWWADKDNLIFNGEKFVDSMGVTAKPRVGEWKQKAKEFIDQYLSVNDFVEEWIDNPQGYAGVLKGTLPHFIFVPAVRDLSDEAKATKSNPFGKLLYEIIDAVSEDQKSQLKDVLDNVANRLNRLGGEQRLESITETENRLNQLLQDYMTCDLEIEFQSPTFETIITTPRLFADDGFRNIVMNKGHGLQRAIIFSILRCYSEVITGRGAEKKRTMIFAVEEPELYMHPQAQRTIRRVFQNITEEDDQVIFSTHSSLLLDVAYFDEIIRVEAIQYEENGKKKVYSKVWQLPMENMIIDLKTRHPQTEPTPESIRELYANAYHPNRSEGFFAKSIILVEGPTEQYALPIYAEAIDYPLDSLNVGVVDSGGKGPMDRLFRIFNELGIPCYLLFDYDKDSTDAEMLDKSRELLEMVSEVPDAPDEPLIKDRVACFPRKWELDLADEIPDMDALTAEARGSLGLRDDTGKPLVARYIARKLTSNDPPYVPPSIEKILKKAIKVEWQDSCLACN